jgi:hypothetical protein
MFCNAATMTIAMVAAFFSKQVKCWPSQIRVHDLKHTLGRRAHLGSDHLKQAANRISVTNWPLLIAVLEGKAETMSR